MGKGDKKTRKGKIYAGSHGNVRPHSPKSKAAVKTTMVKPIAKAPVKPVAKAAKPATRAPAKKTAAKKAAPKKTK
ncbi:MAG TPA: 30S ribosomal protein THX [Rhodanobacteraceae bacterium]|nr:30S ribosomal protein THX [Rhodanobacteraceae bacterium]